MTGYFMMFLNWINRWVGNYGWSIVLFTLIIRLVLLPLDIKSKKSMRARWPRCRPSTPTTATS